MGGGRCTANITSNFQLEWTQIKKKKKTQWNKKTFGRFWLFDEWLRGNVWSLYRLMWILHDHTSDLLPPSFLHPCEVNKSLFSQCEMLRLCDLGRDADSMQRAASRRSSFAEILFTFSCWLTKVTQTLANRIWQWVVTLTKRGALVSPRL